MPYKPRAPAQNGNPLDTAALVSEHLLGRPIKKPTLSPLLRDSTSTDTPPSSRALFGALRLRQIVTLQHSLPELDAVPSHFKRVPQHVVGTPTLPRLWLSAKPLLDGM